MKNWIQPVAGTLVDSAKFMDKVRMNIKSLREEGKDEQADAETKQLMKMEKLHASLRKDLEKMEKMEAKRLAD